MEYVIIAVLILIALENAAGFYVNYLIHRRNYKNSDHTIESLNAKVEVQKELIESISNDRNKKIARGAMVLSPDFGVKYLTEAELEQVIALKKE